VSPEEFDRIRAIGERIAQNVLDPSHDGKKQVFERFPDLDDDRDPDREPHEAQELLHLYRLAAVRRYRKEHAKVTEKDKLTEYRPLESVVPPKIADNVPEYKRLSKEKMNTLLNEAKNLMDRQGNIIQPKKENYLHHLKQTLSWLGKDTAKETTYLPASYLKNITVGEEKKKEELFSSKLNPTQTERNSKWKNFQKKIPLTQKIEESVKKKIEPNQKMEKEKSKKQIKQ